MNYLTITDERFELVAMQANQLSKQGWTPTGKIIEKDDKFETTLIKKI